MKTHILLALLLFLVFSSTSSFADDKAVCLSAASKGQRFRAAHKLVEAREQLRLCAAAQCPAVVQTDCVSWLAEVDAGLPTVVVTATDGAGRDRLDVKVGLDGQVLTPSLQGQALTVNPGPHSLHVESSDGAALDQSIVVNEGIKNQNIAVVLPSKPGAGGGARANMQSPSAWPTVGWIAGAVGVIGLGVGGVFGVKAISDKSGAHCDASNACDAGPLGDANSSATVSTVAFVAGGALVAGGAAIVLFAPSHAGGTSRASLKIGPLVGGRETGLLLGGSF